MSDKLSMSLDDIVKDARAAKATAKKEPAGGKGGKGGKAAKERGGGREAPYSKKDKGQKEQKKEKPPKEKKERPPAEPSTLVFVGGLPFTIEKSAVEAHLSAVAPCSVDMKMRVRGGESKPAGFAIATFESIESAKEAIEKLHETELGGRKIAVRFATPE